jgi:ABC-type uncharacterized transport system substrate-binding protein
MRIFLMFLMCTIFSLPTWTHPHMFIDTRLKLDIDGERLEKLEITWYFDPLFTASIRGDFDEDGNGSFDDYETDQIRQYAFSNLANYDYFTFVMTGGKTYVPQSIENFRAFMENSQLVYRFTVPLSLPIAENELSVAVYDETYFCDILYAPESPVRLAGKSGESGADWKIVEKKDLEINYGGDVSVSREGKSYTGTAYPQQVVITLK